MTQSRKHSFYEIIATTAIGYVVALATQIIVFPWFNIEIKFSEQLAIGIIFTIVSIVRGFFVRRFFNHLAYGRKRTRRYKSGGL